MNPVDIANVDKKIWLVKVPTSVATVWRKACEQSMASTSIDDSDGVADLGMIRMLAPTPGVSSSREVRLTVQGSDAAGIPGHYRMNEIPRNPSTTTAALSFKLDKEGDEPSAIRLDGTVSNSFNLMPIYGIDDKGQVLIDGAYRQLSRDRNIKAVTKTRVVKKYEDTRDDRVMAMSTNRVIMDMKRREEVARMNRLENKRVRLDKTELEALLFRLFEGQAHWTFLQLQRETNQPAAFLKEVLNEVAILCKRGPNKDLYEIKAAYRDGGKS